MIGLSQKTTAFRQIVCPRIDEARSRNNLDRRPSSSNKSGEVQAIHGTRHLDVGEDDVNVGACFQYGNRFVGVCGFDNLETGVTDHFRGVHSQQKVVFDD